MHTTKFYWMLDHVDPAPDRPVPLVIVAPGEYTCTVCGETTSEYYCYRCSDAKEHAGRGQWNPTDSDTLVPTTSYLHPWEYRTP